MAKNAKPFQNAVKFDYFGFRRVYGIIRANFRAYLIINAFVYGLVITGMVAAIVYPSLGTNQLATLEYSGTTQLARSLLNTT